MLMFLLLMGRSQCEGMSMTARKNFSNYWQLDPGFLSQLTGNSDKLEAQGPIMAKAGTILEEDYDPSVDDDLANLLSGITPNEMSVVQGTWECNPLKMTFGWTIGDSDKYVVAFKSEEKPEEETVEEEPEEEIPEECPKENPKVLSSTSWGCPGSQLPNNILHSNVLMSRPIMITIIIEIIMIIIMIIIMVIQIIIIIVIIIIQTITIIVMIIMIMIMMMIIMIMIMSRPLLWQVPRHQYLLLGRGRADRQQVELLVGTEQEGGA